MGFTHQKSKTGMPVVPQGFEQYFFLGLLDGDGTICSSADKELKVFYCGNRETMNLVQTLAEELVNVRFSLRGASTAKNPIVEGRMLQNNHVCYRLQLSSIRESQIFLIWLYNNVHGIPCLQRKYQKFLNFQNLYRIVISCFLCGTLVDRPGTTRRYCNKCNLLLKRLSNRRSDHEARDGIRHRFLDLLTDAERARINLEALACLG